MQDIINFICNSETTRTTTKDTFFSVVSSAGVSTASPSLAFFFFFFLCFFSATPSPAGVTGAEDVGVKYFVLSSSLSEELLESCFRCKEQQLDIAIQY